MRKNLAMILLSMFLLLPNPLFADTNHVLISQIQVAGLAGANDEWIELYNPTAAAVDLSSFSIQYKTATGTTVSKKNFTDGAFIPAHGYYLIAHVSAQLSLTPDMTHSTFSIAASGGNVFVVSNATLLTDFTSPAIVDKVAYGTGNTPEGTAAPAPSSGQTIERKPGSAQGNGTDTDNNSNDFTMNSTPTPHNTNSSQQPAIPQPSSAPASVQPPPSNTPPSTPPPAEGSSPSPTVSTNESSAPDNTSKSPDANPPSRSNAPAPSIVINEMLSNPNDGAKEWIELFSASTGINLTGWKVEDGAGTIMTLDQITTNLFTVIELSSARLNNTGDTLMLKDASGAIVDRMTYGSYDDGAKDNNATLPSKGQSLNRFPDGHDTGNDVVDWFASKQSTKGAVNVISATEAQTTTEVVTRTITAEIPLPLLKIFINEFVSDPADGVQEWVELVNMEQAAVDLTDWTLEDGSGAITNLSGRLGSSDNDRYLVIQNPKGNLNNSGDAIVLRNATKQEVDRVAYGSWGVNDSQNAPTASDPNGVARIIDGFRSGNSARDFQVTTTPTLGKPNRITSPPSSATATVAATATKAVAQTNPIIINELLANPIGEDSNNEWIELQNPSNATQTITNGVIELNNGARRVLPPISIPAHGYFMLTGNDLPPLPNSGATVKLLERQKEIDRMSYPPANHEGSSMALGNDGEWLWTTATTVWAVNVITPPNEPPVAVMSFPRESTPHAPMLFDASDSFDPNGDALAYTWTFSDGLTASDRAVEHVFANTGTASVVLVVSDGTLSDSVKKTIRIASTPMEEISAKASTVAKAPVDRSKGAAKTSPSDTAATRANTPSANTVQIQGVVIAPPSAFNNKSMAIAGSDLPIRLTANRKWPRIATGDVVAIEGKTANTTQGTVLRINNPALVRVIAHASEPKAEIVTIDEALDRDESDLIQITGTIRDIRAKNWLVEDRNAEIVVVPPIPLPRAPFEGDRVTVTGIMEHATSGDRLRARFPSDVLLPPPPAQTTKPKTIPIPRAQQSSAPLIIFGIILAAGLAILVIKEPKPTAPEDSTISHRPLEPELEPILSSEGALQFPASFQEKENNL